MQPCIWMKPDVYKRQALMLMERWLQCEFAGGASKAKVDRIREIECQYR